MSLPFDETIKPGTWTKRKVGFDDLRYLVTDIHPVAGQLRVDVIQVDARTRDWYHLFFEGTLGSWAREIFNCHPGLLTPLCVNCLESRDDHAQDKCLWAPSWFEPFVESRLDRLAQLLSDQQITCIRCGWPKALHQPPSLKCIGGLGIGVFAP